jgi:hypothetical protein
VDIAMQEEVITAKEYKKKMIVVQMCDKYDEIEVRLCYL